MSIKRILLLVSTATLFSSTAFSANYYGNSAMGLTGPVFEAATDSRGDTSNIFMVDFKKDKASTSNNDNVKTSCTPSGRSDIFRFTITQNARTPGNAEDLKHEVWKNMIFLAGASGKSLIVDIGSNCEIYDLRIVF